MTEFRSRRKGGVYVELPAYAAGLLASLTRQLVELLRDGEAAAPSSDPLEAMIAVDGPRETPDDPALRRLLPDAHRDDPEASAEFRRLTEGTLREAKVRDAMVVLATLEAGSDGLVGDGAPGGDAEELPNLEAELDREQVRAWLRCVTDLRLTLAERLGVTSEDDDYWTSLDEDDHRLPVYEIYQWLGYLLESLLDAAKA